MTYSTDVLYQLRRDWDYRSRTPDSRRARDLLDARHPELDLGSIPDMAGVLALLESRGGRSVLEKARLLQALLLESADEFLRRALLQTLLPGVVSTCRQLRFGDGIIDDPSETLGVAIALCAELLVDWAGESRPYAGPDILSALRGRLRRWLLKEKEALRATTVPDTYDPIGPEPSLLLTRLEQLRGGPHDRLARLTYARVFEGETIAALAASDHSSTATLQRELQQFALHQLL
jgi:hypothetical protein